MDIFGPEISAFFLGVSVACSLLLMIFVLASWDAE
jgi:hypothetical protein